MPEVGMHKHVGKKLEGLEGSALDIVQRKPIIQGREYKIGHQKNSNVDQQQIFNDRGDISKHVI